MDAIAVGFLLAACRSLEALPMAWALALGRAVGAFLYILLPGKRRIALRNLDLVYANRWTDEQKQRLIRRMFSVLGRHAVEFCRLRAFGGRANTLVKVEGGEHLARALRRGRGAILVGAHLGNWDLAPLFARTCGAHLHLVTRKLRNRVFNEFWRRQRTSIGVGMIDVKDPRGILRALQANEIVVLVIDQNRRAHEGVFLDFLGVPACTTDAPARLALRGEVPLLTGFARMEPHGIHRMVIEPEVAPPADADPETAAPQMMRECLDRLERVILEAPEQWIWLHRRWRTRPPGEKSIYESTGSKTSERRIASWTKRK